MRRLRSQVSPFLLSNLIRHFCCKECTGATRSCKSCIFSHERFCTIPHLKTKEKANAKVACSNEWSYSIEPRHLTPAKTRRNGPFTPGMVPLSGLGGCCL